MRASSLMGRAFGLRDRGRLDEALTACREAMRISGPVDAADTEPAGLSTLVIGALTVDEITSKMGQSHLAREPIANALPFLGPFNKKHLRGNDLMRRYEQQLRARLDELRSES